MRNRFGVALLNLPAPSDLRQKGRRKEEVFNTLKINELYNIKIATIYRELFHSA